MHILFSFLVASILHAEPQGISARRARGTHYESYFEQSRQLTRRNWPFGKMSRATPATEQATNFGGAQGLRPAPAWDNEDIMMERFRLMRDARNLRSDQDPKFERRATWLYPDDGCYARAGLAIRTLLTADPTMRAPGKIFAFGDLSVRTKNSPEGRVEWWYHVAPVVRVGRVTYVLDPSIEPSRPLTVDEWIGRQTRTPKSTLVAICGSGTYVPSDRCDLTSDGLESTAVSDERDLLGTEWQRLIELCRSPDLELGDNPPWAKPARLPLEVRSF